MWPPLRKPLGVFLILLDISENCKYLFYIWFETRLKIVVIQHVLNWLIGREVTNAYLHQRVHMPNPKRLLLFIGHFIFELQKIFEMLYKSSWVVWGEKVKQWKPWYFNCLFITLQHEFMRNLMKNSNQVITTSIIHNSTKTLSKHAWIVKRYVNWHRCATEEKQKIKIKRIHELISSIS